MIPTGRISVDDPDDPNPQITCEANIVLGPDVVTYSSADTDGKWITHPLSSLRWIEWDDFPFQPEGGDEIAFLQQWISNLSPDELDAAVEAQIGAEGMHTRGEWIKAALLGMLP